MRSADAALDSADGEAKSTGGGGLAQGHTVRTANNHPQVVFVVNRSSRCWGPARGLWERGAHTTQGWAALGARRAPRREGWAHWACQGRRSSCCCWSSHSWAADLVARETGCFPGSKILILLFQATQLAGFPFYFGCLSLQADSFPHSFPRGHTSSSSDQTMFRASRPLNSD